MSRVVVRLPEMREYKYVYVISRPGIVYVNKSAREDANMVLIVPYV